MRALEVRGPVAGKVTVTQVIGDNDEDIGLFGGPSGPGHEEEEKQK
jgi:hypothetical protein